MQEDAVEGWTVGSTLTYIGLGVLAPGKGTTVAQSKAGDVKEAFANL